MNKLIKTRKRSHVKFIRSAGKKATTILIAAALAVMTVTAVTINYPPVKMNIQTRQRDSLITFDKKSRENSPEKVPEIIETIYRPTKLPDGYKQNFHFNSVGVISTSWSTGDKNTEIYLDQSPLEGNLSINTENSKLEPAFINNIAGHKCTNGGVTMYLWEEHLYFFELKVPEDFEFKNVCLITESFAASPYTENYY